MTLLEVLGNDTVLHGQLYEKKKHGYGTFGWIARICFCDVHGIKDNR